MDRDIETSDCSICSAQLKIKLYVMALKRYAPWSIRLQPPTTMHSMLESWISVLYRPSGPKPRLHHIRAGLEEILCTGKLDHFTSLLVPNEEGVGKQRFLSALLFFPALISRIMDTQSMKRQAEFNTFQVGG